MDTKLALISVIIGDDPAWKLTMEMEQRLREEMAKKQWRVVWKDGALRWEEVIG